MNHGSGRFLKGYVLAFHNPILLRSNRRREFMVDSFKRAKVSKFFVLKFLSMITSNSDEITPFLFEVFDSDV